MGFTSAAEPQPHAEIQSGISSALKDFVRIHEISQQDITSLSDSADSKLRAAMRQHRDEWGINAPFLETIIGPSAGLIEHAYDLSNFEEKKTIALYNWYLIYCDDQSTTIKEPFAEFGARFARGLPQLDPVLDALASVFQTMFEIYPTFHANVIVNAAVQFLNSLSIERELGELRDVQPPRSPYPQRFPWYLRHSTGISIGYALMPFPKTIPLEAISCFPAQADMEFWVGATNDLLSYYKEYVAGEKANYISNRAQVESQSSVQVVSDLIGELEASRKIIYDILETSASPAAVNAWRFFERGYITWHFTQTSRYKLNELNEGIFDLPMPGN